MGDLSDLEKKTYNMYLKALAESQSRPYNLRKNFDDLNSNVKTAVRKLSAFFETYRDVNPSLFFKAGFKYETNKFLDISYFNSLRASKMYAKLVRERYNESVDNDESITDFKNGIIFIYDFIKDNDITLDDYILNTNESGVPWYLIHLKKQNISFYHIHSLSIELEQFPKDMRYMIMDNFDEVFARTKRNFEMSLVMNKIGKKLASFLKREKRATKN